MSCGVVLLIVFNVLCFVCFVFVCLCMFCFRPTWFRWLDRTKTGIKYIRDSGFFSHATGLELYKHKGNILNGICASGHGTRNEFIFGKHKMGGNDDGSLYGIIRLDTLAHALYHSACHSAPLVNTGETLNQKLIIGDVEPSNSKELDNINNFVPKISFGGLCNVYTQIEKNSKNEKTEKWKVVVGYLTKPQKIS